MASLKFKNLEMRKLMRYITSHRLLSNVGCILILFSLNFFYHSAHAVHYGQEMQLTADVKPITYDIYLHPNFDDEMFEGKVSILIDVLSKQSVIKLHQKLIEIDRAILKNYDGDEIEISEFSSDYYGESLTVHLKNEIDIGKYSLTLWFTGTLMSKNHGFYLSKYRDENNKTRIIATTHFEPNHAREAFPCFDEPRFKAEFSIQLVHPNINGYHALSNMDVESVMVNEPSPGFTTVSFAKSVPMSTYLICFMVSDFVSSTKEAKRLDGRKFPVSVYTAKAEKEHGQFALEISVKILEYYNKLFDINFPLPKMDIAAVPDLEAEAMENWGLVTYRADRLLYDKKFSSTYTKLWIVRTIAHEFAHMWFGNLVTMKWWDELWLSEGITSFFQYKAAHAMFPNLGVMELALQSVHNALNWDKKRDSHPIVAQHANTADEISKLFDFISYDKGSSVLRMLEGSIGSDAFLTGVKRYLNKFAYKNAETKDLFNCIQSASSADIDVMEIMDTWTRQKGYPVVDVRKDYNVFYTLTQKKFLENSTHSYNLSESNFGYKWTIPITYTTSENATPTLVWFNKNAENLVIMLDEPVNWIKFNYGQVGFYRVNYNEDCWQALISALTNNYEQLPVHDRAHLLEDAFSLVEAGQLNYTTALSLTSYLYNETNYSPWHIAFVKLTSLSEHLLSTKTFQKLNNYIKNLLDKVYYTITWNVNDDESVNTSMLRSTILNLACFVGHTKCLQKVGAIFKAWINDKNNVELHPDIREIVYKYGMKTVGNETDWDILFNRFITENNKVEKKRLLQGLINVNSESKNLLEKFAKFVFNASYVSPQEIFIHLTGVTNSPAGADFIMEYALNNSFYADPRYPPFHLSYGNFYYRIVERFHTGLANENLEDFQNGVVDIFIEQYPEEKMKNTDWLHNNFVLIEDWLNSLDK